MSFADKTSLTKFVKKLERRFPLPLDERRALLTLPVHARTHLAHQDVSIEGDRTVYCTMVESGLVSRTRTLTDGSRQIVSFGLPGDMIDLQALLVAVNDHGVHAHAETTTLSVSHRDLLAAAARYPMIARALWLDTLIDAAMFREWTVNVGQRNARARMAHLLMEFYVRFDSLGLLQNKMFDLPLSQTHLADALGMSIVHVNRTLQWLRGNGLIKTRGRYVTIIGEDELRALSGFSERYLHLDPVHDHGGLPDADQKALLSSSMMG